jgi:hypothetical protein
MNKLIVGILLLLWAQLVCAELHDPTRPLQYQENQGGALDAAALELGLTLVSPDRNIAVIGGQSLKVGDKVGNSRIIQIESNSVQLTGPRGSITLFLLDKLSVKQALK